MMGETEHTHTHTRHEVHSYVHEILLLLQQQQSASQQDRNTHCTCIYMCRTTQRRQTIFVMPPSPCPLPHSLQKTSYKRTSSLFLLLSVVCILHQAGAVYVFARLPAESTGAGRKCELDREGDVAGNWQGAERFKLQAHDAAAADRFGSAVSYLVSSENKPNQLPRSNTRPFGGPIAPAPHSVSTTTWPRTLA